MSSAFSTPRGIVVSIWGKAYVRGANGQWRPLKVGEIVRTDDALLTDQDSIVMMTDGRGQMSQLGTVPITETERVIASLDAPNTLAAPAAGLTGGEGGGLQEGLRVERIAESVTATSLANSQGLATLEPGRATQSNPSELAKPSSVSATSSNIAAIEEGGSISLGLSAPRGSGVLQVVVTQVPAIGQIVTAAGTPVVAGSALAASELPGLRYLPPTDYDGQTPIAPFTYSVSNGTSTATGSTQISVATVNDMPLATPGAGSGNEDATIAVNLGGTDVDGSIASVRVTSLPANGVLLLADAVTAVSVGQSLTASQAAGLLFRPAADFNGSASLAFTVTDNAGATSSPASFSLVVNAVNDPPVARADSVSTVGTTPVTMAVLANDSDVDGDTLSVTGANVNAAFGTVQVNANGSLTFTAAPGFSGVVPITYNISDGHGGNASATLSVNVSLLASVSVDAPALSNDSTPRIVGSTNLPPGATVTLTVTDANGAVQTFTAIVQADGTYAADVPLPLADGPFSATASVTTAGDTVIANDGGTIDTLAPTLTVDAPTLSNDTTPTIFGTTNLPAGSTVTLALTGANGAVQTFTATVQAGGVFSGDVPTALAQGGYTVVATASDAAGNAASASDVGAIDSTAPTLTVDAPALSNDSTPTLTGTTDLPAGATITLTVTDSLGVAQTFTATVQVGGTYSAAVPAALAQGTYGVVASAVDAAGNSANASDNGSIDTIPPLLTVDAPALTNDATPTITGTTDLPAGATVTLTVTGANGAVQTFAATVQAGGTYSADVPAALVQGNYGVVAAAIDAAGNVASASDNGAIDNAAPTLTVDAPALTNDTTPTITGTTDLPAGATVTLTVTSANGSVQTFTTTVQAGGTYSADVPTAMVEGLYGVVASASNAAGNSASANDSGAIDTTPPVASLAIDSVTADNIVNAGEAAGSITLTGTVGGDARVGDTVTLVVNGNSYNGAVLPGNTFAIAVAGADVLADVDRRVDGSVSTTDAAGNTTTATATRGFAVNAAPLAVADTLAIGEDSAGASADVTPGSVGQDSDTDGDALAVIGVAVGTLPSAAGSVGTPLIGTWGTLTVAADGTYTYVPLAAAQTLGAGQTASDVFTYSIADGRGGFATSTVTVNILGTNDAAVISTATVPLVETNAVLTASGALTISDVDSVASFVAATIVGTYGSLAIDAAGAWTYTASSAHNEFVGGTTYSDIFTVTSADGTTSTVTVNILGTNDAAVIAGTTSGAVTEAGGVANGTPGAPTASGTLTDTDVDNPANTFQAVTAGAATNNGFGTYAMTAGGVWTYTLNNNNAAVQALNVGGTLTDTFAVLTQDGTSQLITVTINGRNDSAVIAGTTTGSVIEAGGVANGTANTPIATGTLTDTDVDNPANTFQAVAAGAATTNGYGTFAMTAGGLWTYTLNNSSAAVQALNVGSTLTDTFSVLTQDGTNQVVTVTINGRNDAAVIAGTVVGAVIEASGVANGAPGTPTATGTLTDADVDNPANTFQAVAAGAATTNGYGTFAMTAGGVWTYTLNNSNAAVQTLNVGNTLTDTFTVLTADGTSQVVTVTINGANDAAVIAGATSGAVTEAGGVANGTPGTPTATGTLTDADVDNPANTFQAVAAGAATTNGYGTFAMTAGGVWTYTLNNNNAAVQTLNVGGTLTDTFTVLTQDGTAQLVSVTINGTNDAPVASASQVTAVEDQFYTYSLANFAAADVDGTIASVTLTSLPVLGDLYFNGSLVVAAGLTVTAADLAAGRLQFRADPDQSGGDAYGTPGLGDQRNDYASFAFTVTDNQGAASNSSTMAIDVTPVADATTITAAAIPLPASTGLTRTLHDTVANLNATSALTLANIEIAVEAEAINATGVITGVTPALTTPNVGNDDAIRISGFVYLQAGSTYTFSGTFQDTLTLEIGGQSIFGAAYDGNNSDNETISGASFTPAVSGFYSVELISYNVAGGAGFIDLFASVNGGPPQAFTTANFNLQATAGNVTTATNIGPFMPVTDSGTGSNGAMSVAGYYQVPAVAQGKNYVLPQLTAAFGDSADNSESHTITLDLSGAPIGTRVFVDANNDGVADDGRVYVVSAGNTSVVVFNEDNPSSVVGGSNWNLAALVVDTPNSYVGTFNISAVSRAAEIVGSPTTSTLLLPVTLLAVANVAPEVVSTSVSVSEEGLAGGLVDSTGTVDTTNSATASGTISITDTVDSVADTITAVTLLAPSAPITSGGVAVTWSGAGTGTLTGTAGGNPVATLTINAAGAYTFTLQGPIDHAGAGVEDVRSLQFGVVASDGVNNGTGTLTINVEDDQPNVLTPISNFIAGTDTNLLITLDISGSMGNASGIPGLTRLQAAIQSINTLLDRYDEFGAVAVRLVTFSDTASAVGATWMSVAAAKTALAALTLGSSTDYNDAIAAAQTAFATTTGRLVGAQNVGYFFSDGAPTAGDAITAAQEATWTSFLNTNLIRSFAIGMGSGVPQAPMNPVAFNGQSNENTDAVVVAAFDDLDNVLAGTIQSPPSGPLAVGGSFGAGGAIGADGGYVASLTIEGTTYAYNPAAGGSVTTSGGPNNGSFDTTTNTLAVTTSRGGSFAIDLDDGTYRYSAPNSVPSSFVENVAYTITDRDGDMQSSTITVTVDKSNTIIGTASSETLTGTAGADYIVGRDGNDILFGQDNNDALFGNNGTDTLNGGNGNDRLAGGAGNDILTGGAGADTFEWKLIDRGAPGTPAIDQVTDFETTPGSASNDVLDLRDLLQGETASATLDRYLDFNVVGSNTEIRISSAGGFVAGAYAAGAEDQRIVLQGVDIRAALGLGGAATDGQIIAELINRGKLITDVPPGG